MNIKTYTRNELTEILQVSLTTVGTLINQGDIFSIKVGKSIRVPEWALRDYLMGKPAYKPGDPISEPDYQELPTDSLFKDSGNDSRDGDHRDDTPYTLPQHPTNAVSA